MSREPPDSPIEAKKIFSLFVQTPSNMFVLTEVPNSSRSAVTRFISVPFKKFGEQFFHCIKNKIWTSYISHSHDSLKNIYSCYVMKFTFFSFYSI